MKVRLLVSRTKSIMSHVTSTFHHQQLAEIIRHATIIHLQQEFDSCYPLDQK